MREHTYELHRWSDGSSSFVSFIIISNINVMIRITCERVCALHNTTFIYTFLDQSVRMTWMCVTTFFLRSVILFLESIKYLFFFIIIFLLLSSMNVNKYSKPFIRMSVGSDHEFTYAFTTMLNICLWFVRSKSIHMFAAGKALQIPFLRLTILSHMCRWVLNFN